MNKKVAGKIIFKIIFNLSMLILIVLMVILLTNIPQDIGMYKMVAGQVTNDIDYVKYKEDVKSSIKLLTSGEFFKFKVFGRAELMGEILNTAFSRSMTIFFGGLILAIIIGIPKGIFDSRRKKKQSSFKLLQTLIPLSVPDVLTISLVQLLGLYLYSKNFSIFGSGPILPLGYKKWVNYIYPTIALSLVPSAYIARVTATSIENIYDRDFILTARGKGASEMRIIWNHIMRNVLTDLIAIFPTIASIMFSSLFIVERIFYFPGVAFEMLAFYNKPSVDGTTTIAYLGLAVTLAVVYFILYTILDIIKQILIPKLEN